VDEKAARASLLCSDSVLVLLSLRRCWKRFSKETVFTPSLFNAVTGPWKTEKEVCEEKNMKADTVMPHATRVLIATAAVHQTARQFEGEIFFVIMAVKDTARRMMKNDTHGSTALVALTLACQFLRGIEYIFPSPPMAALAPCRLLLYKNRSRGDDQSIGEMNDLGQSCESCVKSLGQHALV
jgi:hypothetical protein